MALGRRCWLPSSGVRGWRRRRWPVPIPTRVAIELILFGVGTAALAVAGQPMLAVVLGVAVLATSLLNASQERQVGNRPPDP